MKPTMIPSTQYIVILTIATSSFCVLTTNVFVEASTVSKVWKKINFFTASNGSKINETMSIVDEIQPTPVVQEVFVCPTLKSDVLCSTDWDPYICGTNQCEYSNDCVAQGSGFNVTAECRKSSEPSTEAPVTEDATVACPTQQSPDFFCTAHWDPYECGANKCQYGNDCEALVAGFNVTTNCTRVATTAPTTTTTNDCPTLPTDLFCEEIWKPYICADKCRYPNDCYASASGFNVATDCIELPI
jgi:hypothetical protein